MRLKNINGITKEMLISPGSAEYVKLKFLKQAVFHIIDQGYEILGLDGLYFDENETIGFVDVIYDFSNVRFESYMLDELIEKILDRKNQDGFKEEGLCVDIVFGVRLNNKI